MNANPSPKVNWPRVIGRAILHTVVITVAIIWLLPSMGVFVNTFRPKQAVGSTGWWTILVTPFDFTQYSLENVINVLAGNPEYVETCRENEEIIAAADSGACDELSNSRDRRTCEQVAAGERVLRRCDLLTDLLSSDGMARAFLNSLSITVPSTIIPILVAAFAAYAFAWMEFPGRQVLFVVVVGLLVVPLQMTLIPVQRMFNVLGLTNNPNFPFLAIWLAHTGYGLPFAIYLLRNFFGALPRELFESAYLDGASKWTAFWRLALPLSVPAVASLAIFQFLWVWNDLLVALIFTSGRYSPVTRHVANLVNSLGQDWQVLPAAATISMILPLVIFFALQRYFIRGILAGSVKG